MYDRRFQMRRQTGNARLRGNGFGKLRIPLETKRKNISDLYRRRRRRKLQRTRISEMNFMNRKGLKREYKETRRPLGVFQIRNFTNEKVFIGSTLNLDGIFNRHRFQLKAGNHFSKALQKDWNEFGEESFAFEILEEVVQRENLDLKAELEALEDLWLEKAASDSEEVYNEQKKTREERLRMIAANRKY